MGTQSSPTLFGPCLLWPNGWMDQDVTWYRDRPRPGHCVRWGLSSPPPKKIGHSSSLMSGPCLLWPNGWMDQDATSYGARSWPRRHCVRWGPSSATERGTAAPHFLAHFARSSVSATAEFLILVLQCCEWALPLSFPSCTKFHIPPISGECSNFI